ncbi:2492_t:CDS:1, partial [Ambispora gerdemannii]
MSNISRGIICRHYFWVMMYSKVVGFHIQIVPVWWYNDEQKDKDIITSACCFANQESAKNQLNEILMPNPSTISKSVTCVLCHAAQRKVKYGE